MQKLVLLDAYALIFRAYYGLIRSPRINSKGQNTSAAFGFINTLEELLRKKILTSWRSPSILQEALFVTNNFLNTKPHAMKLLKTSDGLFP